MSIFPETSPNITGSDGRISREQSSHDWPIAVGSLSYNPPTPNETSGWNSPKIRANFHRKSWPGGVQDGIVNLDSSESCRE